MQGYADDQSFDICNRKLIQALHPALWVKYVTVREPQHLPQSFVPLGKKPRLSRPLPLNAGS